MKKATVYITFKIPIEIDDGLFNDYERASNLYETGYDEESVLKEIAGLKSFKELKQRFESANEIHPAINIRDLVFDINIITNPKDSYLPGTIIGT